ncbi:hypothetical protein F6476_24600 [Pseudomonas umsongensis]|jgi:hypothetical protein|uniref:Uncharacterized protein n=1 Tax=Pseudomonas umsongensis TaxID=198618 RepID=A0ABX4DP73_9PSED|nr:MULTISPECIES: hypothetical protein [Pseudomonas]KEX93655.1 hypothetical protein HA62_12360 [Pseudomonas putida]EPA94843.1 hypothetical protein PG5_47080 [Pseudomonas sp. G5(2012)]OXR28568.1 hypothetical protein PSUM_26660 [Pseudomonas umsongensis]QFG32120.1 hypothetical protein F6476_24600 [Pseudomonas umsongensis]SDT66995.1 hypothetical protein SAMN04490206_4433 [Pseudomonas umsongensis]
MARKAFEHFEAVSAVVPGEGGYHAAIAVKALGGSGAPRFHKVLEGQTFKTAHEADDAAAKELTRLKDVKENTDLLW